MTGKYRAFQPVFVDYMNSRGGWPEGKVLLPELEVRGHGTDRNALSDLRKRRNALSSYTYEFVAIVLTSTNAALARSRTVLLDYLRDCGLAEQHLDMTAVLSHVCMPPTDQSDRTEERDWISSNLRVLADVPIRSFLDYFYLSRARQSDTEEVVSWLYTRFAQCSHPRGNLMSSEDCLAVGAELLVRPFREYVAAVHSWNLFNPWTVLRACKDKESYGMSIMLPTTEAVYKEIRAGNRAIDDIRPSDIVAPSSYIIFLATAENPAMVKNGRNPTKAMLNAIVVQHAALMRYGSSEAGPRYQFIAPEGTKENRARMVAGGFRALSTRDARTKRALWERVVDFETGEGVSPVIEGLIRGLSRHAPSAPPAF